MKQTIIVTQLSEVRQEVGYDFDYVIEILKKACKEATSQNHLKRDQQVVITIETQEI